MDVYESIKNIRAKCDIYIDPDLVSTVIYDNSYMGSNNFWEMEGYAITEDDSYEDRFMKILKEENVFINCGMLVFIPMMNECDIFSIVDETIEITQEEYDENSKEKEVYFGILIEKNSSDYSVGVIDLCNCKVESGFRKIRKSDDGLYKKLAQIIDEMIIS